MIRDIVVQLTGSPEDEVRISFAAAVARTHGAHLIGAHLHVLPDILKVGEPARSSYAQTILEESEIAGDNAFAAIEEKFLGLHNSYELRRFHGMADKIGAELAATARTADLFVGTRPYGDPDKRQRIEEEVLFGSGRGCLFLPPGGRPKQTVDTILVAWDGSRTAARAVAEAIPFLQAAETVIVGTIADSFANEQVPEPMLSRLQAHLGRYEIATTPERLPSRSNTGEEIEALAHQRGADLIVAGAYGQSKYLEWMLGGVTRHLLRHATLPLLMAH